MSCCESKDAKPEHQFHQLRSCESNKTFHCVHGHRHMLILPLSCEYCLILRLFRTTLFSTLSMNKWQSILQHHTYPAVQEENMQVQGGSREAAATWPGTLIMAWQ